MVGDPEKGGGEETVKPSLTKSPDCDLQQHCDQVDGGEERAGGGGGLEGGGEEGGAHQVERAGEEGSEQVQDGEESGVEYRAAISAGSDLQSLVISI